MSGAVPEIPMYGPFSFNAQQLRPGETYLWCSCGRSGTEPLCDGQGCRGSGFEAVSFVAREQTRHLLCGCKYTRSPPWCDGSHSTMPFEPRDPPCRCPPSDRQPPPSPGNDNSNNNDGGKSGKSSDDKSGGNGGKSPQDGEGDIEFRAGSADDEEFYIEGVREMFVQNDEPFTTEPTDRFFFRRNMEKGGVLVAGPGHKGLVLFETGNVTPFMPQGPEWWNSYVFISDVYVARKERGRKLAGKLIERVVAQFDKIDYPETFAAVYAANDSSLKLFKGLGFAVYATIGEVAVQSITRGDGQCAELVGRPFCEQTDKKIVVEGLIATSERPLCDAEEEFGIFCRRFAHLTTVWSRVEDGAVGWTSFEVTNITPYGVDYGEYFCRFGFVHYLCVAEKFRQNGVGRSMVAELGRQCVAAGVDVLKSGYCGEVTAAVHHRLGFVDNVHIVRRDNK